MKQIGLRRNYLFKCGCKQIWDRSRRPIAIAYHILARQYYRPAVVYAEKTSSKFFESKGNRLSTLTFPDNVIFILQNDRLRSSVQRAIAPTTGDQRWKDGRAFFILSKSTYLYSCSTGWRREEKKPNESMLRHEIAAHNALRLRRVRIARIGEQDARNFVPVFEYFER